MLSKTASQLSRLQYTLFQNRLLVANTIHQVAYSNADTIKIQLLFCPLYLDCTVLQSERRENHIFAHFYIIN